MRRKKGREEESRMCIDYILYTPPTYLSILLNSPHRSSLLPSLIPDLISQPINRYRPYGIRAVSMLDFLPRVYLGNTLLPSAEYPSDHVAIAADLEIIRASAAGSGHE